MNDIVIAEAVRSAVGRAHKGSLAHKRPDELAGDVIRGLLERVPAGQAGAGRGSRPRLRDARGRAGPQRRARSPVCSAVCPQETSAHDHQPLLLERAAGDRASRPARSRSAQHDIVVAGGVESMTMVPMTGFQLSASPEADGADARRVYTPMGITAENVAKRFDISRQEQDEFALQSQQKAAARGGGERVRGRDRPGAARCAYKDGQKRTYEFERDELPRPDTTLEGLAQLKPAFAQGRSVTAGNASPLSDGAAAALVMSKAKADELGIKPLGYFRAFVDRRRRSGDHGHRSASGGAEAARQDRARASRTSISSRSTRRSRARRSTASASSASPTRSSTCNGGAIALGHPLGCTGAKLTATALHELRRRSGTYAIVTMCIGGGQGAAGLFEAIS